MKTASISSTMYDSMNTAQSASGTMNATTSGSTGAKTAQKTASSATTAASSPDYYYDVRDLNRDGVVTLAEEIQYALTHPGEVLTSQAAGTAVTVQAAAGYNQQGNLNEGADKKQATIDITV